MAARIAGASEVIGIDILDSKFTLARTVMCSDDWKLCLDPSKSQHLNGAGDTQCHAQWRHRGISVKQAHDDGEKLRGKVKREADQREGET